MKDDRYELAERHGMSKEFIDWFFDNKKSDCGNVWLIAMAAMWEGWKASREQLMVELPDTSFIVIPKDASRADCYRQGIEDCARTLNTAGITVKSD